VPGLPSGSVLAGRYTVERQVGRGGMGSVYAVTDGRLGGKRWALKEMISEGLSADQLAMAVRAFAQEATLLAGFSHPNLPQVIDFFSEGPRHFVVMEFVEGRTLQEAARISGGTVPESVVSAWAIQICAALIYLHGRRPPVIFRDLKPANIMLTADDRIKLIDFGIARLFKQGQEQDTSRLGTHGYAAPECYGQGQSDARTDVYSLGATLHFLLTGDDPAAHPFIFKGARTLNSAVSSGMDGVISRAVKLDPEQRFQTMEAARTALISVGLSGGRALPGGSSIQPAPARPLQSVAPPIWRPRALSDPPPRAASPGVRQPPPPASGLQPSTLPAQTGDRTGAGRDPAQSGAGAATSEPLEAADRTAARGDAPEIIMPASASTAGVAGQGGDAVNLGGRIEAIVLPEEEPAGDITAQAGGAGTASPAPALGAGRVGRCPRCAATLPIGAMFCGGCGQQLSGTLAGAAPARVTAVLCARCKRPLPSGSRFCGHCGATTEPPRPMPLGAARSPEPGSRPCPRCGQVNPSVRWHCAGCGAALPL